HYPECFLARVSLRSEPPPVFRQLPRSSCRPGPSFRARFPPCPPREPSSTQGSIRKIARTVPEPPDAMPPFEYRQTLLRGSPSNDAQSAKSSLRKSRADSRVAGRTRVPLSQPKCSLLEPAMRPPRLRQ